MNSRSDRVDARDLDQLFQEEGCSILAKIQIILNISTEAGYYVDLFELSTYFIKVTAYSAQFRMGGA